MSLPIVVSNAFDVVVPILIVSRISLDHAMNLFLGSDMTRRRRSHTQPRIVFISVSAASALSFCREAMS